MPRQSDFLHGIVISAACSALPVRKKLPTAYSYNGTILPKLPEWDRSVYPYVFINLFNYVYVAAEIKYVYTAGANDPFWAISCFFAYRLVNGSWKAEEFNDVETAVSFIKWANFDVLNEDGSVFLKASEPMPVYE